MPADETVDFRATLQMLGDDVHILESFLDFLVFEDAVRAAKVVS